MSLQHAGRHTHRGQRPLHVSNLTVNGVDVLARLEFLTSLIGQVMSYVGPLSMAARRPLDTRMYGQLSNVAQAYTINGVNSAFDGALFFDTTSSQWHIYRFPGWTMDSPYSDSNWEPLLGGGGTSHTHFTTTDVQDSLNVDHSVAGADDPANYVVPNAYGDIPQNTTLTEIQQDPELYITRALVQLLGMTFQQELQPVIPSNILGANIDTNTMTARDLVLLGDTINSSASGPGFTNFTITLYQRQIQTYDTDGSPTTVDAFAPDDANVFWAHSGGGTPPIDAATTISTGLFWQTSFPTRTISNLDAHLTIATTDGPEAVHAEWQAPLANREQIIGNRGTVLFSPTDTYQTPVVNLANRMHQIRPYLPAFQVPFPGPFTSNFDTYTVSNEKFQVKYGAPSTTQTEIAATTGQLANVRLWVPRWDDMTASLAGSTQSARFQMSQVEYEQRDPVTGAFSWIVAQPVGYYNTLELQTPAGAYTQLRRTGGVIAERYDVIDFSPSQSFETNVRLRITFTYS